MSFNVVVMGCTGGPQEGNLSGYLVAPQGTDEWIALDAGSLMCGMEAALQKKSFAQVKFTSKELTPSGEMLTEHIKAYLISHAHLDHMAGLVLNSQVDTEKPLLGIDPTIDNIRDHLFNGRIWPNYGSEGVEPTLNKYTYHRLQLGQKVAIAETSMHVEAFLLCHPRGYPSTAYLVEHKGSYVLYFGDTSSDKMELEKHMARVWKRVAPLVKKGALKGMFLECSFPHNESHQVIYGHLDTKLMMHELNNLAEMSESTLKGLKVIVTHRKKSIKAGADPLAEIQEELTELNDLELEFVFPSQGDAITL